MCSPQVWDPNFTPQVPGSAPWAAEGGVRRQGPSFLSPRRLWRRVSQEVPGPLPWCPGPVPPVPSPEACPSDRGPRPGRGLWCRAILSENADTWAPHRQWAPPTSPPPAPPLQRLLLQANPPSRSQTPGLGQERGHWELPRSQSTLQTPPAVTGPCMCAAVSERSLLRRGLSQGPALGQAWCRDVRPGEHLLGSLGRCRRPQTPGGEGRGQTKGVGRKRGCRQSDLTGVGSKSPPGRVVVGGQAQACHFFS